MTPCGPAEDSPAAIKADRTAAVGTLRSWESNSSQPLTTKSGSAVEQVEVMEVARWGNADVVVPSRRIKYKLDQPQQVTQLATVRSWNTQRLLASGAAENMFFSFEVMRSAVTAWRASGGTGAPPVSLLRRHATKDVLTTMTTQFSGHIWSVKDQAPFDAGQCCAALETGQMADPLHKAVKDGVISESEVRQCGE